MGAFISPDRHPTGQPGVISARFLTNTTIDATSVLGIIIPTLYVMLEERFPRRVEALEGEPVLQGDPA